MRRSAQAVALAFAAGGIGWPLGAGGAGAHSIAVSAVVLSASTCNILGSPPSASTINIGTIDPASGSNATGTGTVMFRCTGSAATAVWAMSNNNGLYGSSPGALQMRHGTNTTEFLPYSLTYPTSGSTPKLVTQTITVTATVTPSNFQNALPGNYSDTVVLSINP